MLCFWIMQGGSGYFVVKGSTSRLSIQFADDVRFGMAVSAFVGTKLVDQSKCSGFWLLRYYCYFLDRKNILAQGCAVVDGRL